MDLRQLGDGLTKPPLKLLAGCGLDYELPYCLGTHSHCHNYKRDSIIVSVLSVTTNLVRCFTSSLQLTLKHSLKGIHECMSSAVMAYRYTPTRNSRVLCGWRVKVISRKYVNISWETVSLDVS
uniref:Uncharacterized protein n=1 Tax=Timema bartmani TaxID=61472 RepID=A0A7R9EWR3_9NEOP|nr:unnamed protein product [Timema bartmani]